MRTAARSTDLSFLLDAVASSVSEQLTKDIRKNATIQVVIPLPGRINPNPRLKLRVSLIGSDCFHGDFGGPLLNSQEVVGFRASQTQSLAGFSWTKLQG